MATEGLIISVSWIIWALYWLVSSFGAKRNIGRGIWKYTWLRFVIIIVLFFLFRAEFFQQFVVRNFTPGFNPFVGALGVFVCVAGLALAIWARVYLGRNWGMPMSLKENPELVTTGPYAYIRNPIYTGALTAVLGTSFVVGVWFVFVFIFIGVYFIFSAKVEERIMLKEFPDQYPEYKKRTKMLIPFVF